MPIVRFKPGETAPRHGDYALMHEWGEPTGITVSCDKGERLPPAAAADVWYVLVGIANELAQAA